MKNKAVLNIVMVPSENGSPIVFENDDPKKTLHFCPPYRRHELWNFQHLYAYSTADIKKGDCYYDPTSPDKIYDDADDFMVDQIQRLRQTGKKIYKVEATTDESFWYKKEKKDGHPFSSFDKDVRLPKISEDFVKYFIKLNGQLQQVKAEIKDELYYTLNTDYNNFINIVLEDTERI